MASESKSTGLLKIVSALFLIWAVANILVMLGINSCAGIAGHASTDFLERTYCHPQMESRMLAAERLSNVLFPS